MPPIWTPEFQLELDRNEADRKRLEPLVQFEKRKLLACPYRRPYVRPRGDYRYNSDTQTVEVDVR